MEDSVAKVKVLIGCKACGRRYDASELPLGSLFHCYCGELVEVPSVTAKDATVVRCSACGAPRSKSATACEHCRADFSTHERDMHTSCPDCLARISDRARFCHHCGTRIGDRTPAGRPTDHDCPACPETAHLSHRQLGGDTPVLECPKCAGVWLTHDVVERIVEKARAVGDTKTPRVGPRTQGDRPETATQSGPLYRRCPICSEWMLRVNHGRRSGVIVDRCRAHGVWFDEQELASIVAWIRSGDERRAERRLAADREKAEKNKRLAERTRSSTVLGGVGESPAMDTTPLWLQILGRLV